jgi:hypothetical protein
VSPVHSDGAPARPVPGPPRRRCQRYRRDGSACTNITDYVDGWCRKDDCAGFVRSSRVIAPEIVGGPKGTARHLRETGVVGDGLDPDDLGRVRITTRAADSFRYHHGGSDEAARVQLETMLDDFLRHSARSEHNGLIRMARDGFQLVVAADLLTITGYSTVHRERTWAQVRAGVRSRISPRHRHSASELPRGPSDELPEPEPSLRADAVAAAVDPRTVMLTARVRRSYARLAKMTHVADNELDDRLRDDLRALLGGRVDPAYERVGAVDIVAGSWRWRVRDDALVVIGVARAHPEPVD